MDEKQPAVYMMSNRKGGVIYTGVTSNIIQRVSQHRFGVGGTFTAKYKCKKLVYYELFGNMLDAIAREKQIKAGSRADKIALIENANPEWRDFFDEIV